MRKMTIFFGMVLGLGVVLGFVWLLWPDDTPPPPPSSAGMTTSTKTTRVVVVKKVGQLRTLYKFADFPNDCAMMELKDDASFYPKGGTVRIHPPNGGEPWDDTPGVPSSRNGTDQPPGWYMVCKKDPGAWGVETWN